MHGGMELGGMELGGMDIARAWSMVGVNWITRTVQALVQGP